MKRRLQQLFEQPFDIVVVGGGIYGATIARSATDLGYRVALVEKGDFGSGTSANSLKILHGGLRYLQHLDIARMRRSIHSRNYFLRNHPHLIENVSFLMPLRGYGMKGPLVMGAGFLFNDLISFDRNKNLAKSSHIARGEIIGARRTKRLLRGVNIKNCSGGASWPESIVENTERLVLELIKSAADQGAVPLNYVKAMSLACHKNKLSGVVCHDLLSTRQGTVRSKVVIDASGSNIGALGKSLPGYSPLPQSYARAVNLVLKGTLFGNTAVGLPYQDDVADDATILRGDVRTLFFVPWKGNTMVGTFYDMTQETKNGLQLTEDEKQRFLVILRNLLPGKTFATEEICRWHSGWLPISRKAPVGRLDLAKSSTIRSIQSGGELTGFIEVAAAKFTTAPVVASRVVKKIAAIVTPPSGNRPSSSSEPPTSSPGSPLAQRLLKQYGPEWKKLWAIIEAEPEHERPIYGQITAAEILYAIREEMACSLSDVVLRRTEMAECELPGQVHLDTVADLMGIENGWSQNERAQQLDNLQKEFRATLHK